MDLKRKLSRLTNAGPGSQARAPVNTVAVAPVVEARAQDAAAEASSPSAVVTRAHEDGAAAVTHLEEAGTTTIAEVLVQALRKRLSMDGEGEPALDVEATDGGRAPEAALENVLTARTEISDREATRAEGLVDLREEARRRFAAKRGGAVDGPADARVEALRQMLSFWAERQGTASARKAVAPVPEPRALPVEARATPHGTVHVAEQVYSPDHRHGTAPVAAALDVEARLVAGLALHPELESVDFTRMLMLDTETTGLAGGTGTVPFLVGLGWFEGRSMRVQQLFLRRMGEEAPMLRLLAERMASSSCLVTYNGKSFDWPLLRTRFVLNRVPVPKELPHLDLLHCARRVFKHRGEGARLVHLESKVLGHHRIGDVDGSQIPELYFRFLRGTDGSELVPVLEHNQKDILLLAALMGDLVRRFQSEGTEQQDPRDLLGFAQVAERAGDAARALTFAKAAAESGGPVGIEALTLASRLCRRSGDCETAVAHLQRALTFAKPGQGAVLHLSLTKLYEHSLKDLPRALYHARLAAPVELPEDHQLRMERLERRLSRQGA
ncbi:MULTISPECIES: ribonuclease H-like domain-containing protein [unclassified Corallococcus]|uniref:ribonuclease H-like domain-containing protein n=1 Tax=unclassified Corallococcus TaxID=2685029 RepID=UPI001A8EB576|nr:MULTISPECIES: ribonuclease H-like domain-containing protein [unclassified Corallococcus]MBN9685301.1 ribonuclease H-like domain-containing protein [Corallococcus sp. NCSPR001]WAS83246.1 ribonuclease H-like domain-containing protein [Corallococcus sp. NCRR]